MRKEPVICILHSTNTLRKYMNTTILLTPMGNISED